MTNSPDLPRRVLAVAAHPDDLEILCGGTMALYVRAGCDVVLCNATNGDRGSATMTRQKTARVRALEAERSAAVIGASYRCLEFSDGGLDGSSLEARERFVDLVRESNPDVVFTHHPNDYHADHCATSKLSFDATFMATVPLYEAGLPATDGVLPVFYMDTLAGIGFVPERYVDITPVYDQKLKMLTQHRSQVEWMKAHDNFDLLEFMETMSKFRGIQSGVLYAEAFAPAHAWLRERTSSLLP
jgi:LmbE family N-acetylglucosaminyl deacetylase